MTFIMLSDIHLPSIIGATTHCNVKFTKWILQSTSKCTYIYVSIQQSIIEAQTVFLICSISLTFSYAKLRRDFIRFSNSPITYSSSLRRVKGSSVLLALLSNNRGHCWGTSLVQFQQCSFCFLKLVYYSVQKIYVHLPHPSLCFHWYS